MLPVPDTLPLNGGESRRRSQQLWSRRCWDLFFRFHMVLCQDYMARTPSSARKGWEGCKSTNQELVGLTLSLLTIPQLLQVGKGSLSPRRQHCSCLRLWNRKIRAIHIISCYLGCIIHVLHLSCMSTPVGPAISAAHQYLTKQTPNLPRNEAFHSVIPHRMARGPSGWLGSAVGAVAGRTGHPSVTTLRTAVY
jgi:hypothetical protein